MIEKSGIFKILQADVILTPWLGRKYVHVNYDIFVNNKHYDTLNSSTGYGGTIRALSFEISEIKKYILSADKKEYRKNAIDDLGVFDQIICSRDITEDDGLLWHHNQSYIVNSVKCVACYICPRCANITDNYHYTYLGNKITKNGYGDTIFKLKICSSRCREKEGPVFYSPGSGDEFGRDWIGDRYSNKIRDPRHFLYKKNAIIEKGFYKKYVVRHLNRIKKLRPVSKRELTFFRSWLGARDLSLLAN